METFKAFAMRRSSRGFKPDQIPDEALEKILDAGCVAPVGRGDYDSLHLAVVQNSEIIDKISDTAKKAMGRDGGPGIYYGAPTIVIVSAKESPAPGLDIANAACVADHMLVAAADLSIGSIFIWATAAAVNANPELAALAGIPEGYKPQATVALGYPEQEVTERAFERKIAISKV